MVAVLTVGLALGLFALAGLVIDGGRAITARQHAADLAGQAARAGADQLDLSAYRSTGIDRIDAPAARVAACAFVAAAEPADGCQATVTGDGVTVTVTTHTATVLLGLIGYDTFVTRGAATAHPERGVLTGTGP
ncbi:MAG TPA: pilus assembly protein TadG-related protein [Mycobacteriales bacterium]|nr:pilus assembly protein TadG-related protein [Mycobacteriales bacterium]